MMRSRKPGPLNRSSLLTGLLIAALTLSTMLFVPACGGGGRDDGMEMQDAGRHEGHDHTEGASSDEAQERIWTCSMHPDIKLKEPGKCPICYMDLIPLEEEEGESLDPRQLRMTESAAALASIATAPVVRGKAVSELRLYGTVVLDETRVAKVTARISGRLDVLFVEYAGALVRKGEPLAEIYSPELFSAQEEFIQAGIAARNTGGSGSDFLDSSAERNLEAAREKLRLYGLTKDQIEQIESSGKVSDRLVIRSPVSGTVVTSDAVEGIYVSTGTALYTVADLSRVWVTFRAFQSDLAWLREGQVVEFGSESMPGERFEGEIIFIDPVLDSGTRTAGVRVAADNPDGALRPDMFVSGVIYAGLDREGRVADRPGGGPALLIPASAPLITGTRAVVYVRLPGDGDPVFEGREIVLGPRAGDQYVVMSGLAEGEEVVVNGAFKIDSELQIRARPSMMSSLMEGRSKEGTGDHDHGITAKVDPSALKPVYDTYFKVQMALAADDLEKGLEAGAALEAAVGNVDPAGFGGMLSGEWKRLSKKISEAAGRLSSARDIAACRDEFDDLSGLVIEMHKLYGHSGPDPYFLTFCPMANSNKGAFWLQEVDTVYNSHYGAMMLRCGEIRERLEPRGN